MTDTMVKGRIYLRVGDSSLFKVKGACNVFSGLFSLSKHIPFYFLNYDDNEKLPNPVDICKANTTYEGVIYQLETPGISIPNSKRTVFKFTKDFVFVEDAHTLTPLGNIAYISYNVQGTQYVAIPYSSIASIEFNYVL